MTAKQKKFVEAARAKLAGRPFGHGVGHVIHSRDKKHVGVITVVGHGYCGLEGCTGVRLYVTWEDGNKTRPCSKGCSYDEATGEWLIL